MSSQLRGRASNQTDSFAHRKKPVRLTSSHEHPPLASVVLPGQGRLALLLFDLLYGLTLHIKKNINIDAFHRCLPKRVFSFIIEYFCERCRLVFHHMLRRSRHKAQGTRHKSGDAKGRTPHPLLPLSLPSSQRNRPTNQNPHIFVKVGTAQKTQAHTASHRRTHYNCLCYALL